jgi:putative drug exporter of the RND superfamily
LGRAKWIVLVVWAVLVGVFGPLGMKLPDVANDEVVLPASSDTAVADSLLAARFPGGQIRSVLLVYDRHGGLTAADRVRIRADARRAAAAPLVESTLQPFYSARGDIAVTPVILTSRNGFRVRPTIEKLRELQSDQGGLQLHVTGTPALLSDFNSAVKDADVKLLLATGALVLLLLIAV